MEYPPLPQLLDSSIQWVDDIVVDRAVQGNARGRAFYATKKREITLSHAMSIAEYAAFESFYDDNRTKSVVVTWCQTGAQYVCIFDGAPSKPDYPSPDIVKFTVKLAEI